MEQLRLELGSKPDLLLFRNQSGELHEGRRHEKYGLAPGASDLIGIRQVVIAPRHVGLTVGRFFALEVKAPGKLPTKEQNLFLDLVSRFGGHAGWCDSLEGGLVEYRQAGY